MDSTECIEQMMQSNTFPREDFELHDHNHVIARILFFAGLRRATAYASRRAYRLFVTMVHTRYIQPLS
jgi:hypothetical protein